MKKCKNCIYYTRMFGLKDYGFCSSFNKWKYGKLFRFCKNYSLNKRGKYEKTNEYNS